MKTNLELLQKAMISKAVNKHWAREDNYAVFGRKLGVSPNTVKKYADFVATEEEEKEIEETLKSLKNLFDAEANIITEQDVEDTFQAGAINEWAKNFILNLKNFVSLSESQQAKKEEITQKILRFKHKTI